MPIPRPSRSTSLLAFESGLVNRVIDAAKSSAFISANKEPEKVPDRTEASWRGRSFDLAVKDNIATKNLPTTCASRILGIEYHSPFEADVISRIREGAATFRLMGKTNMDEFGMGSHSMNSAFGRVIRGDDRGLVDTRGVHNSTAKAFSPGGSSGGSAVAVERGFCSAALGTDTGGSVRLPAAYVGIVGFKPSYGLVSRCGVVPYANSLDTVGFMARYVAAAKAAFECSAGYDPRDPTSLSIQDRERANIQVPKTTAKSAASELIENAPKLHSFKGLTIGFPLEYNIEELDPKVREAWKETLRIMESNGARVVPVSLPNTKHALSAYYVLAPAEAASNLSKYDGVRYGSRGTNVSDGFGEVLYSETRKAGFGPEVQNRILLGSYALSSKAIDNYFIQAQKVRRLVQRDFDRIFKASNPLRPSQQFGIDDLHESIPLENKLGPAQVDFIVCPTAPTPAPSIKDLETQTSIDSYMNDVFTVPASLAGLPAISIPYGAKNFRSSIGIQIIGQFGSDYRVLKVADQLERVWQQHRFKTLSEKLLHEEIKLYTRLAGPETLLEVEHRLRQESKDFRKPEEKARAQARVIRKRARNRLERARLAHFSKKIRIKIPRHLSSGPTITKHLCGLTIRKHLHLTDQNRQKHISDKKMKEVPQPNINLSFDAWDSLMEKNLGTRKSNLSSEVKDNKQAQAPVSSSYMKRLFDRIRKKSGI